VTRRVRTAAVLTAMSLLAACGSKPLASTPAPQPAPVTSPAADSAAQARLAAERAATSRATAANAPVQATAANSANASRTVADAPAATSATAGSGPTTEAERRAAAAARATMLERVYFGFNDDEISVDQRTVLDAKLPILLANPRLRVRIAGHTDERGSDEYNLALGQRRAASVMRYFTARGVTSDRFEAISFGRERPLSDGHDEDSWAKNRRAEFELIAGAETMRAPR
jgi:peptidoglycan-associated lipoprotein